ncbi:MAG: hypothetical protein QGG54_17820, partial [Gammaproteobacteria bacterium]|nr:hypothetical protein [Gammaproteobacteria bacterium]
DAYCYAFLPSQRKYLRTLTPFLWITMEINNEVDRMFRISDYHPIRQLPASYSKGSIAIGH